MEGENEIRLGKVARPINLDHLLRCAVGGKLVHREPDIAVASVEELCI